jgi:hypothetical protein
MFEASERIENTDSQTMITFLHILIVVTAVAVVVALIALQVLFGCALKYLFDHMRNEKNGWWRL